MSNRNELPSINAKNFQQRLRETVQTYLGRQGDSLDRGVTVRDLVDSGIVSLPNWWRGGSGTVPLTPGSAIPDPNNPTVDLTPPPTPTGFKVDAAISNIFIEHDAPLFRAGGGYASTVVYGVTWQTGNPLPTFDKAVQITEFQGQVFAHATNPSTTWHLWIKWKSKAGVLSSSPAGGTNGLVVRTGEDVALLLEALTGEITESQLYTELGERIDLIDGGPGAILPALPKSLVEMQAEQTALNHSIQTDLNDVGNNLLQALVKVNEVDQKVTDAGLYVDPGTGEVKIYALEATREQLNQVSVDLNAAEATLALKASVTYVDNAISTAVLDPSQVPIFGTLEARLTAAEIELDGLDATVTTKASSAIVDAQGVRLTQAESDIDGLQGQITLKVNTADYTAEVDGLDARLGTAETTLSALGDVSSITQVVSQSRISYRDAERNAEAILRAILRGDKDLTYTKNEFATVRTEYKAELQEGLSAEAAARLELSAAIDDNAAAIVNESVARATAIAAEATARNALGAQVSGNTAALNSEITTRATETSALSSQITALGVTVAGNTAAISSEVAARANADTALSSQITALTATVATNTANISTEATARADADTALSGQINTVSAVANAANRSYRQASAPSTGLKTGDVWWDSDDGNKAYRWDGSAWQATDDTRIASNAAAIVTEATARATADSANATSISQVQARLDSGDYAAVKVESAASASTITGIQAKYTVKIDANGYVTGYGLMSEANNGTPVSSFAVRADQFYIASPSGPGVSPSLPFIVRTTPTTIGGVSVPVGVYLTDAFIQNGTISNAKIANLAVDDAKIANLSVSKLTAGSVSVGQHIQSSNYIFNTQGWKIGGDGFAEFGAASIRGQLTAGQIDSRGLTIKDNDGNVLFGASQNLNISRITGLGALAVQNTVSTGQVTGLGSIATYDFARMGENVKIWNGSSYVDVGASFFVNQLNKINTGTISTFIESAAIGNAYIGNAAISSAKIQDGAITNAKIGDAQITTAKIGDLQVNTLQLAGNAVTIPEVVSIGNFGSGVGISYDTPSTVASRSIYMSDGGKVFASCTVSLGWPNGTASGSNWKLKMIINNVVVQEVGGNAVTDAVCISGSSEIGFPGSLDVSIAAYTKTNVVYLNGGNLFLIGVKR